MASLYLIPTTLGESTLSDVLPEGNTEVIRRLKHFIVEEERTARRFLKQVDKAIDIDSLTFYPMGKHSDRGLYLSYLEPLRQGEDMGIVSEAGCPAIADPGSDIVALAQAENLEVVPLVGPSSILLSLMASGFNGQNFAFVGYLPAQPDPRRQALRKLEARAYAEHQTQIFIETPYRNEALLDTMLHTLRPQTRLCIAAGLTTGGQIVKTRSIDGWKRAGLPSLKKVPTIFLIYAPPAQAH